MTTQVKESVSAWDNSNHAANPNGSSDGDSQVRLLFVDDDEDYREAVGAELVDHGFSVHGFPDGASMMDSLSAGLNADVILLDWSLSCELLASTCCRSSGGGASFCLSFSSPAGRRQPTRILAFDKGALDFVDKARGVPILAKRLRLILESSKRPQEFEAEEILQRGRLVLKPRVSRAYWNDVDINLTLTEFNIVKLLASSVGDYVTYRAVYDCMHHVGFIAGSGEHGYRTNVRSCIKRICNKFRESDPNFAEIENFPSFGYRWGKASTYPG